METGRFCLNNPDIQDKEGNYLIVFPIGDWSEDGHGKYHVYTISSKKPAAQVRDAHYKSADVVGFDLETICKEYEESTIKLSTVKRLKELGYGEFEESDTDKKKVYPTSEELVRIWAFILNKVDPDLNLKIVDLPSIVFYGKDTKGRQVNNLGYGIFE